MLQGLFNSLSGMMGFSKGLDTIGNNISNMNTPGFRGENSFFENVADGLGTQVSNSFTDTSQGDIQQTGTSTDVAVNGNGLFILRDSNGNTFYTRAGHFQFDPNGILVDDNTGYRVAGINSSGGLADFNISDLTTLPPVATTTVNFSGNLALGDSPKAISGMQVYDATGTAHTLTATFTSNKAVTSGSWLVVVKDESGATVGNGEIRFDTTGALTAGFSSMTLNLDYNGNPQKIGMAFGTPGTFSGTTSISGAPTSLGAQVADGHGVLGMSTVTFDSDGILQITYSDAEKKSGPQLALAHVADEQSLLLDSAALYTAPPGLGVTVGKAGASVFGNIEGGSLELSNVDLTRELTQMIIVQRGYQASSRVMTVTDAMLQQLYSSTGGGGG